MTKRAPSQTYTITYCNSKQNDLDSDFLLVCIEAHSHEDAMTIVNNIERYFDGVTVTCEPKDPDPRQKKHRQRREQRPKVAQPVK